MDPRSRLDRYVVPYTHWVIRWRWPILLGTLLLTLLGASGARFLSFDTNYRAFFKGDNPQLLAFEAIQDIYTKNDNILFVLAPKDGDVFTPETMAAVDRLTAEAWKIPHAIRVDAVSNFQHTRAEGDDLLVADLIEIAADGTPETLEEIRQVAIAEPLLNARLVSEETDVTGINVTLQFPGESIEEIPEAVAFARQLVSQFQEDVPDVDVYVTGIAMLNNAFSEASLDDMMTLVPLMYLAMMLIMFFSLRSVSGTFATMVVVTLSAMVAMGLGGWFKVGLTPPSAQVPTIVMTLAIADSIHILVTLLREMRKGMPKWDAIVESIRINMQPVFLTSISTAIGFLSMNFSEVPPFQHLGNMAAAGVMAAFVFSVLFLPALMAVLPVRAKKQAEDSNALVDRLGDFVVRRRRPLLWGSTLTVLLLAILVPLNSMDDRFIEYFDDTIPFRQASDFTMNNLTGIYQIEFSLEAGESGAISEPAYLATVDQFASWYREQPGVQHVNTFTDVMKRLNMNLHSDDPAYYRLPDDRELAAQYLLLYEMSLPYGLDLNNQINVDKSATRFTVTLENMSTTRIRALAEQGEQWLRDNAAVATQATGSGAVVMFAHISGINIRSMLIGSILALVLISGLMIFALRDFKIGLLSLVPNLVPALMAFGIWGIFSGEVNIGLSLVIGMTLGIVVDDSIHFLTKYLRARREQGLDAQQAVRYAFTSVGRALIVTSLILIIGFGVLSFSSFGMNASMGKLTAITIGVALVADFLLLPPLLMWMSDKRPSITLERTAPQDGLASVPVQDLKP